MIERCGLTVVDHPARADLARRYFAGRADGLRPYDVETLITACVAGANPVSVKVGIDGVGRAGYF